VSDDLSCCGAVPAGGRAQRAEAHGPVGDLEHLAVDEAVLDPHQYEVLCRYRLDAHRWVSRLFISFDRIGGTGGPAVAHRTRVRDLSACET
jgi:hypothetical protein